MPFVMFAGVLASFALLTFGLKYRFAGIPVTVTKTQQDAFDIAKRMPSQFRGPWWPLALLCSAMAAAGALGDAETVTIVLLIAAYSIMGMFIGRRAYLDAWGAAAELGIPKSSFDKG